MQLGLWIESQCKELPYFKSKVRGKERRMIKQYVIWIKQTQTIRQKEQTSGLSFDSKDSELKVLFHKIIC